MWKIGNEIIDLIDFAVGASKCEVSIDKMKIKLYMNKRSVNLSCPSRKKTTNP